MPTCSRSKSRTALVASRSQADLRSPNSAMDNWKSPIGAGPPRVSTSASACVARLAHARTLCIASAGGACVIVSIASTAGSSGPKASRGKALAVPRGRRSGIGSGGGGELASASARSARSSSRSLVRPWSIQSDTSPFSGKPSSLRIATARAVSFRSRATVSACACPASSLSGRTTTRRAARNFANSERHLFAPPGLVVAVSPSPVRRSASFSPSTRNTGARGLAAMSSGRR